MLFVWLMIMIPPMGWTPEQRLALKQGYAAGLVARLTDPVSWRRSLIATVVAGGVMVGLVLMVHYATGALRRLEKRTSDKRTSDRNNRWQ
jgi:hypothetical protein